MKKLYLHIAQISASLAAVALVIAAHYLWQGVFKLAPSAVLPVYMTSFLLFAAGGHFILWRLARRSYQNYGQLTTAALFLLCTVWGLFFAFPSLYHPYNWAWSVSDAVSVPRSVRLISLVLVISGLLGIIISILWLGTRRSLGQPTNVLMVNGPYRYTRNPQLLAGALIVTGYFLLRPSWYAAGWFGLFLFLGHLMVMAEEEHLRRVFGKEYQQYRNGTPRYLLFH